jgi:hypothetical protein
MSIETDSIEIPLSVIKETPNNYELGEKVRILTNQFIENEPNNINKTN